MFTQKQKGREEEADAQKEAREGLGGRCAHGGDGEDGQEGETDVWRLSWLLTACFLHFLHLTSTNYPCMLVKLIYFLLCFNPVCMSLLVSANDS